MHLAAPLLFTAGADLQVMRVVHAASSKPLHLMHWTGRQTTAWDSCLTSWCDRLTVLCICEACSKNPSAVLNLHIQLDMGQIDGRAMG